VEAPDEASHNGSIPEKIKAIEHIDRDVLGVLMKETDKDTRFLIVTDHATPIAMRTHYATPVPFAVYDRNNPASGGRDYDEEAGGAVISGEEMIKVLIGGHRQ